MKCLRFVMSVLLSLLAGCQQSAPQNENQQNALIDHLGHAHPTAEEGDALVASLDGTQISFEELRNDHIGRACAIITTDGGGLHSGAPCPPGMVTILKNNRNLTRGELIVVAEDCVEVRALFVGSTDRYKTSKIPKQVIRSIILLDKVGG